MDCVVSVNAVHRACLAGLAFAGRLRSLCNSSGLAALEVSARCCQLELHQTVARDWLSGRHGATEIGSGPGSLMQTDRPVADRRADRALRLLRDSATP